MDYKNCKPHARHERCRECAYGECSAWCSNDECKCGCHNTPTYTMSDFTTAQWMANQTSESVKLVQEQQASARIKAENVLAQLNAELTPFKEKQKAAEVKLRDLKQRVLGPWQDQGKHNDNAYILIAGSTDKCWGNRVWLRLAGFAGYQWALRIQGLTERDGNRDWVLGPPIGPRKEDLAANKLKAEAYIIKMGYILNGE